MKKKLNFGSIIPLVGGNILGCTKSAGEDPSFHLSYSAFANNEKHLREYQPNVPFYYIDEQEVPDLGEVDYVNTTCPCAGLSMLSTAVKGIDAPQNDWLYESANYVLSQVKPKVMWGENAPGLFTGLGKEVAQKLIAIGKEHGYSFSMIKTNTQLHGIPQRRYRTFYFFWNTPTVPILNWKKKSHGTLLEYLAEIPEDATHQDWHIIEKSLTDYYLPYQFVLDKLGLTHPQYAKEYAGTSIAKYIHDNNLVDECIEWLDANHPGARKSDMKGKQTFEHSLRREQAKTAEGKGFWDSSPRFYGEIFGPVIKRNMKSGGHPVENRFLNVREALHLMGMPHDFQVEGQRALNHIAQNVPVNTAADWADEVTKFINGELKMSDKSFLKQDNCARKNIDDYSYEPQPIYRVESVITLDEAFMEREKAARKNIEELFARPKPEYRVESLIKPGKTFTTRLSIIRKNIDERISESKKEYRVQSLI